MGTFRRTGTGLALAMAIGAGGFAFPSSAASPSGTAIAVIQSSEADGESGRRMLAAEAPVFSGDRIITGPAGEAQIRFRDNTRLVVGPNSLMTIDAFVFDGGNAGDFSIEAARGAFRFITGTGPKDAYSITTPTATIGVRGTEFDVSVEQGTGVTRVANFSGTTRVCRRSDAEIVDPNDPERHLPRCIETSDPCGVSVVRPERGIHEFRDQRDRNRELAWYFQYVRDQSGLLSDFRVSTERCGDLSLPEPLPSSTNYDVTPPRPVSPY
jgi:hypothetical protein